MCFNLHETIIKSIAIQWVNGLVKTQPDFMIHIHLFNEIFFKSKTNNNNKKKGKKESNKMNEH